MKYKALRSIAVSYEARVIAQVLCVMTRSQRQKWRKKTLKEADKQRLKMRRKDSGRKERRGQGERIKKRGDKKTDGF